MSSQSRTVRVFLSSTFRDFAEERDLLVRKVFPELRRKCRERQVELVDVDLRWGITEEEAQQGKVLPICLAEIDRSRPFFMGFIGERYGWIPEQEKYDLSLIMEQPWLDEHRGGKSVTELEMLHGVLNNPAMEDRAFFYFRDPKWSQKKGGAYMSEGSAENEKLEALKNRIRQSGFPVVEDYPTPEALAEQVKKDLWKLINEAFPESEVPDALAQERMRHEAFAASRLGLYIGGERYFEALDTAMVEEPCKPVLVCGASGGGKSALLANWAQKFYSAHPEAIVLTHFLGIGSDAAHPVNMAIRLLREMARITGEEFMLEGDPRKALRLLEPWLEKAGVWAREKGRLFILVLDALDKMTEHRDLDWWPRRLPEGVALVASCLDGGIRDAILPKMEWHELRVSSLERADCEKFLREHLAKYRKSLTPEQTALVLEHPLCGNPLFLRTLLEELRVFGIHEELKKRLAHYLASETIDDLFEKVLDRIESDNTPESVRAALEVLWAAKESFAEDELLTVSQLPPAVWAPIHIALDESLIGAGGRIAFSHDYLRKAVEDRYLNSELARQSIQKRMAEFCAQAMAGNSKEISRYVRRHAVEHFLEAADWDNATAVLSDLEFIEARAIAQELPEMLKDYAKAVELLPEGEKERQTEAARQAELDRYAKEMVEYSATWSRIRDGSGEAEPILPCPVESVRLWTEEEIAAERKRMTESPNRLDIVKAFRVFVATNSAPLQKYATQEAFAAILARNEAPAGPVHVSGEKKLGAFKGIKLLKQFHREEVYNPLPTCQAIWEGHADRVSSLAVSSDGRRVFSASWDSTLRVWDVESGQCLHVFDGHTGPVSSLAVSSDGRRVFSASWDNTLRVWDVESGQCLGVFEGHTDFVDTISVSFDSRRVISASRDNTLRIWEAETGLSSNKKNKSSTGTQLIQPMPIEVINIIQKKVLELSLLANKQRYITFEDLDGHLQEVSNPEHIDAIISQLRSAGINILDIDDENEKSDKEEIEAEFDTKLDILNERALYCGEFFHDQGGQCLHVLEGHEGRVTSIALSADGRRVFSGSWDNTLRVWDTESGQCLHVLKGHTGRVASIALSADGRRVFSGSWDNTLRVWDTESGQCLHVLKGHTELVDSLAVSADGRCVFSGSRDNTLRVWDVETGQCLRDFNQHDGWITALAVSADGCSLFSGSSDHTLRVWDTETGQCTHVLTGHATYVTSLAVSGDGRRLFSGSGDNTMRIWDLETGQSCLDNLLLFCRNRHRRSVDSLVISGNARRVLSQGEDNTLRVWDTETGQCIHVLEGHTGMVNALAVSADGRRVFSASWDKTLRIWGVTTIALSADGRRGFLGSNDKTMRIWDVETGLFLQTLKGHKVGIISLGLSADDSRVFSARTLRIWDVESGQRLRALKEQDWKTLAVSADSRSIFSGSENGILRVCDVESGRRLHMFYGHTQRVDSLVLSADGRRIVSGSMDQTLRIWDMQTGECLNVLEGHTHWVTSLVLSTDGNRIVSGSYDHTLRIWDIQTGECLNVLEGHADLVNFLVLSADGRCIVSGSDDNTLRIWDMESGACLGVQFLRGKSTMTYQSRTGKMVAGFSDGRVEFYDFQNLPHYSSPAHTAKPRSA